MSPTLQLILTVVSLLLGSGVGTALLGYIVRHEREHQRIRDSLARGSGDFGDNRAEHREFAERLRHVEDQTVRIGENVKWLVRRHGGPVAGENEAQG